MSELKTGDTVYKASVI